MIFYRFGEIPEDACSSIWNNNNEVIGKEKGVSVYEAHKNINNYSEMSIEDLKKLKIKFLSQRDNIENIIGEIINNIRAKKLQVSNHALREHPYYKDNTSYLKVVINDGTGYTVTKITPSGKCIGIYQFNADTIDFLKYYKICSQSVWESAIDRLNIWFKDASLKIKKL